MADESPVADTTMSCFPMAPLPGWNIGRLPTWHFSPF